MIDRLITLYRRMNFTVRRIAVFMLAFIVVLATMHVLTFPAAAMSRSAGETDPGIVTGEQDSDPEASFDNGFDEITDPVPEGEDSKSDIPEDPLPAEPAEITEASSEDPTVIPESSGEPVVTETELTEVPAEAIEPEAVETPQPTETTAEEEVIEENEEPEEESDPEADVETAKDWEDMFRDIELTGAWADDLITLAETQIGYKESTKNFIRDEGKNYGYTRYGEWYGDPYAEWDSLFVMFNLSYAGITPVDFPYQADCEDWIDELKEKELFHEVNTYIPAKGDLVFADTDDDGETDHVAIVKGVIYNSDGRPEDLVVIEGDIDNAVKENRYEFFNPLITGFAELPENPAMVQEEEAEAEVEPRILSFTGSANRVDVTVLYEEGAFPEGTTMQVKAVWDRPVIDAINETVASDENVEVVRVQAVDITFYDAEGNEIEPSKPIQVTMKSNAVPQTATDKPVVVHVDNEMGTSVMNTETPVEAEDHKEAVTFEAGSFSVYAMVYTLETYYTSFDGETFKITLGYTSEAELPEGAELDVREILPESEEYNRYLEQISAEFGYGNGAVPFGRFFDISIRKDGEEVEPRSKVSVSIELDEMPSEDDEVSIVHFKDDTIETIEQVKNDASALQFETDSFSVYGVITAPGEQMDALNGRIVTINVENEYLTSETRNVANNPTQIVKTGAPTQAASWLFESAGSNQEYYISTVVDGVKKYMNITTYQNGNSANLTISDTPQALNVRPTPWGTYWISATLSNGTTYYVNRWENGNAIGFACWNQNNRDTLLNFTFPTEVASDKYAVVIKYEGNYYVVHNDGSLDPVSYDPETNIVEMESPILWEYRSLGNGNYNLRIATEASHFDGVQVADEFYYRYIDPATETADEGTHGVRDESAQNTDLSSTCTLQYEASSHRLVSGSEYIGVGDVNGKLHITGKNTEANAAEVYFARVTSVPAPDVDKHPDHTVNHIDISVTGSSSVTVPLAYGDYYDASGRVIYKATEADHKITMSKSIDITKEDIKKATITAFIKNADGTQTEVPNAYYVTGYSGNGENDPNQVRIEGSFKVANLPSIPNADDLESVRNARLQNKIYYTVSTVKEVEFTLEHDGDVLYDSTRNPITVKVPVTVSASFSYWDNDDNSKNSCPGIWWIGKAED